MVVLPLGSPIRQAAAHAQEVVDGEAPGVTLPKLVSEVKAQYTAEAMRAKIEGTVVMTAVVRTDGTPSDIEITESLDAEHGLDREPWPLSASGDSSPVGRTGSPCPSASKLRAISR